MDPDDARGTMSWHSAIAAACISHGVNVDRAEEICSTLEEEPILGSELDVSDALGDLAECGDRAAFCKAIMSTLPIMSRAKPWIERWAHRQQTSGVSQGGLDSCSWKREYKSELERFHQPYVHDMGCGSLILQQRPFGPEGFASTVWDSAIVLSRYFERHSKRFMGRICIELGAGTGLPGLVLSALGARVVLTDLGANLPLLSANVEANLDAVANMLCASRGAHKMRRAACGRKRGVDSHGTARVAELRWGESIKMLSHSLKGVGQRVAEADAAQEHGTSWDMVVASACIHPLTISTVALHEDPTLAASPPWPL